MSQADLSTGRSTGASFELATALKGGELGAVPLKTFQVFSREGKGAPQRVWSSASCTLTLERNESSPTNVFKNRFLLAGRGSCTAPLEPVPPNTSPAVTVSAFEMTAFVDPK